MCGTSHTPEQPTESAAWQPTWVSQYEALMKAPRPVQTPVEVDPDFDPVQHFLETSAGPVTTEEAGRIFKMFRVTRNYVIVPPLINNLFQGFSSETQEAITSSSDTVIDKILEDVNNPTAIQQMPRHHWQYILKQFKM